MQAAGVVGAIVATAAMFIPSSVLMMVAGSMWKRFSASKWKDVVAVGLEPVIIGLVWSSVLTIGRGALHAWPAYVMAAIVTVLMIRTSISAPLLILMGAAGGAAFLRSAPESGLRARDPAKSTWRDLFLRERDLVTIRWSA